MNKYKVTYKWDSQFEGNSRTILVKCELHDIISGFWINECGEMTKSNDNKHFILSHRIIVIEKIK